MIVEWINRSIGANLSEEQLSEVKYFSLLWNILEGKYFNTHFSIDKAEELIRSHWLDVNLFEDQLTYFKRRYIIDGKINQRFQ